MSSALFEFPYQPKITKNYGVIPNPRITVLVKSLFGFEPITFLVDTGADITMLPRSWAQRLGVKLGGLPSHTMLVASGREIAVYQSRITVKFRPNYQELLLPCTFTASDKTPLLLGRLGIFADWTLKFSHRKKSLTFES